MTESEIPTGRDTVQAGLVSGGMDSTTAAAVANEEADLDLLVYLDTGTGLRENREYIEELADHLGVQLWTLRTHEQYEQEVKEHGFPGPSRHGIYYSLLKERQLDRLNSVVGNQQLVCWTGVRSSESARRMLNVSRVDENRRGVVFVSPIHDWSKQDCRDYVDENNLPRNPLWSALGRSGDCFCGCFGSPEEKLDLRAAGCGYHADWLEDLEQEVDTADEREVWAWGALSDTETRALRAEKDGDQMLLCSSCMPIETDGGHNDQHE